MINIEQFAVSKNERTICSVSQLTISPGERVVVVGANGSGKTTLLRVLAGLEQTYEGRCDVSVPARERSYVHQSPYLFRGTVLFNVQYGLKARGYSRATREQTALHWLNKFGLGDMAARRVTHLSGGEKRRVALARAMAIKPRLLLLDEPLADMDSAGISSVVAALDELSECTIVIAAPGELPPELNSRVYRLETAENVGVM